MSEQHDVHTLRMGEYNGRDNYVAVGTTYMAWENVPLDLGELLKKKNMREAIMDFSLGTEGRWWIQYRTEGSGMYSGYSTNALDGVKQDQCAGRVSYVNFGGAGIVWGFRTKASTRDQEKGSWFFSPGVPSSFRNTLDGYTPEDVLFSTFGINGDWAILIGQCLSKCEAGKMERITYRADQNEDVVCDMNLSPLSKNHYWIQYANQQSDWSIWWYDGKVTKFKVREHRTAADQEAQAKFQRHQGYKKAFIDGAIGGMFAACSIM